MKLSIEIGGNKFKEEMDILYDYVVKLNGHPVIQTNVPLCKELGISFKEKAGTVLSYIEQLKVRNGDKRI